MHIAQVPVKPDLIKALMVIRWDGLFFFFIHSKKNTVVYRQAPDIMSTRKAVKLAIAASMQTAVIPKTGAITTA